MTSTRTALLASILANPQDDTPRLVYADWMEEHGEVERAEFVRLTMRMAKYVDASGNTFKHDSDFGRMIGEFAPFSGGGDCSKRGHIHNWSADIIPGTWEPLAGMHQWDVWNTSLRMKMVWHRGFISSVRLPWDGPGGWLRHHERLYWSPGQTVECRCRGEYGEWNSGECRYRCESYPCSPETGRIPRLLTDDLAATCQPLEEVSLNTWPGGTMDGFLNPDTWLADSYCFTREKCSTCGGIGQVPQEPEPGVNVMDRECPTCHGTPPNRWTCDAWPGITFVMPEPWDDAYPSSANPNWTNLGGGRNG